MFKNKTWLWHTELISWEERTQAQTTEKILQNAKHF